MKKTTAILIYDDDCPLCAAYTAVFVKTGLLDKEGRKNFSDIEPAIFNLVDKTKCRNEIPLIDTQTKKVLYGIDAMLEILDKKIPFIKFTGNIKPIKWLLQKLYRFISYNRKVITATTGNAIYDCSPDFNVPYRVYFLLFFLLFNTAMLWPLHQTIFSNSVIANSTLLQLQAAHLLLVAAHFITAASLGLKKGIAYLGQVNMLALTCILLIVPLHLINKYSSLLNAGFNNFYLGMVSMFIIKEYIRRMKYVFVIPKQVWIVLVNIICLLAFIFYLLY